MTRPTAHAASLVVRAASLVFVGVASALGGLALGCTPPGGPLPEPVAPRRGQLLLGAAGAPQGTFGVDTAPDFVAGFASLAADGFDTFLPIFLTNEDGTGTNEPTYFLPPEALPGFDPAITCASARNPWQQAGDIGVLLPAYLLALDQSYSMPLDPGPYRERLAAFVETCLGGDEALLRGLYLHDEPASNAVGSRLDLDPFNDFVIDNVRAMAEASREVVEAETFIVEAPLPFALPLFDVPPADRPPLEAQWQEGVRATAPLASAYGHDLYAIDVVTDVSPIGEYVERAIEAAPDAMPLAVLQGFGSLDMGIPPSGGGTGRQPTLEETRAMAFEALVRGAEGLFWYGQSALSLDDDTTLGVWNDVRTVVGELRALEPLLLAPVVEVDVGNSAVHASGREIDGGTALLVVNPTSESQRVLLPAGGTDALSAQAIAPDVELSPYQVLVVR